jgi:hypothetical protein
MIVSISTPSPNAEYIWRAPASDRVVRLAVNNSQRLSGVIRNLASSNLYIRFGDANGLIAAPPYISIPPRGGNSDIPANFTGEIWGIWEQLDPIGSAVLHHYYYKKS